MRKVIFIILVCTLATTAAAQAITVRGGSSCGQWIASKTSAPPEADNWLRLTNEIWLIGYLSGRAMGTNVDFFEDGPDNESMQLWMDNYCRENPLSSVTDGAENLWYEVIDTKE